MAASPATPRETPVQVDEEHDDMASMYEMFQSMNVNLCERVAANYKPRSQRLDEEKPYIYYPSSQPLSNQEKFGDTDPNEDGLYVEKVNVPTTTSANLNKLEQRLLKENGGGWYEKFASFSTLFDLLFWSKRDNHQNQPEIKLVYEPPITQEELASRSSKSAATSIENVAMSDKDDGSQNDEKTSDAIKYAEEIKDVMQKAADAIDPYDPENIAAQMCKVSDNDDTGLSFCSMEEALDNPRIRMLMLRAQGAPHLKNVAIPLNERKIDLLVEQHQPYDKMINAKKVIEEKHEKGLRILNEVYEKLLRQSQDGFDRPRALEDLVVEHQSNGL